MAGVRTITRSIGHAGRHAIARFAQCRDVCRRNGDAPVTAGIGGGGVTDTVQGYGDAAPVRLVAGTGDQQVLAFLGRVDHVVNRQGIDGNHRRGQGDVKRVRRAGAVARFIGDRGGDRLIAVSQRAHVCRRNAHAPASGTVQHRCVVFAVQGQGNHIARLRARHLAGDNQRLAVLGNINNVVARHNVEGNLRHGSVDQHGRPCTGRVARFIGHSHRDRRAAVGDACHIRRRYVQRPAAVCLHLGGVLIAVEGHGDRLACFGSRRPAQGQILRRLCRIQHVVAADGVDGDRWRGGSDAECLRGRGRIAVHVGYADLYAGVAVLQAAQIGSRYGAGPVAVGIDRRGPGFTRKDNGNGLARFNVRGGAGQHQILAFFCRVQHVVVRHVVNAYRHRGEIDIHHGADVHRVAGGILRAGADGERPVRPPGDVCGRNRSLPCAVRQYRCGITLAVDAHGDGATRRQVGAGAGDNQVLRVFNYVNDVVTGDGINAQAGQLGVNGDIQGRRSGIAVRVRHAGRHGQVAVAERG